MKPKLEVEHVKFFFEKFLDGDLSDINFRQSLVDTFINKVYLFEDKLCVICNAKDSKIEIPLHDTKCSYKSRMAKVTLLDTILFLTFTELFNFYMKNNTTFFKKLQLSF